MFYAAQVHLLAASMSLFFRDFHAGIAIHVSSLRIGDRCIYYGALALQPFLCYGGLGSSSISYSVAPSGAAFHITAGSFALLPSLRRLVHSNRAAGVELWCGPLQRLCSGLIGGFVAKQSKALRWGTSMAVFVVSVALWYQYSCSCCSICFFDMFIMLPGWRAQCRLQASSGLAGQAVIRSSLRPWFACCLFITPYWGTCSQHWRILMHGLTEPWALLLYPWHFAVRWVLFNILCGFMGTLFFAVRCILGQLLRYPLQYIVQHLVGFVVCGTMDIFAVSLAFW